MSKVIFDISKSLDGLVTVEVVETAAATHIRFRVLG